MTREQVLSLVRHGLSAIGGYLVFRGIVDESVVLDIIGSIFALIGIGLSIADKSFNVTRLEGALRQVGTTLATIFVFINPALVEQITVGILGVFNIIFGQTDKLKIQAVPGEPKLAGRKR